MTDKWHAYFPVVGGCGPADILHPYRHCTFAWGVTPDLYQYLTDDLGFTKYSIDHVETSSKDHPFVLPSEIRMGIKIGDPVFYQNVNDRSDWHAGLVVGWGRPTFFRSQAEDPSDCPNLPLLGNVPSTDQLPWIVDHNGPAFSGRAFNDISVTYDVHFVHIPDFLPYSVIR